MTKLNAKKFDACIFTSLCVRQQEKIIGGGEVADQKLLQIME
ncbi:MULTISPECIES: hypothetical protein [Furfurilactobacillus]|jgi:hypothetical protein|nr:MULTISPECIES: hypothetical protein [Furfurilactobacillus]QLE67223.1 hypothetical protein LROSL2_1873 [Furfurilactobacillus rossiae]QLE69653.1 hypothetical protein LROSL3_1874 [Furfurilactobacillus rossiae]